MSQHDFDIQTDFSHKDLYTFLKVASIPEYVKEAEIDDCSTIQGFSKLAFADQKFMAYPINTAARTYVSNTYFQNKKAAIVDKFGASHAATIEKNIKEAAELFDISKDIENYNSELNIKEAADYSQDYILTVKTAEDEEMSFYPVKTKQDLIKAACDFAKNTKNYPFDWRKSMAESFVKKAESFDIEELPDIVCKYAGLFYPDITAVKEEVIRRKRQLNTKEASEIYDRISEVADTLSTQDDVFKIAEMLYMTELEDGCYKYAAKTSILGDPVDRLFTLSLDKVASMLDVVEVHDKVYRMKDLQKIGSEVYKQATGLELDPKCAADLRDILPTVPRSDMSLLEELSGLRSV